MTLALTILLTLLAFPVFTYIFLAHPFSLFPFLHRLLSTPVSFAQFGLPSLSKEEEDLGPDEFDDEERWKGFNPSFEQQIETRQALLHLLPFELCTHILRLASYHTLITVRSSQRTSVMATSGNERSLVYLRTDPLPPRGKLMQVRVAMRGRDQGFSGTPQHYGTYEGSSSYYQTSLLRSVFPSGSAMHAGGEHWQELPDSRRTIQYNVHSGQYVRSHSVVLDRHPPSSSPSGSNDTLSDYRLADLAEPGDVIQLEISARWPAWANRTSGARIDCYYALYDDDA